MKALWVAAGILFLVLVLFDSDMRVMLVGGTVGLGLIIGSQILIEKSFKSDPMKSASGLQLVVQVGSLVAILGLMFGVVLPALK